MERYKRRFGDRYDGRRIRNIDPFFRLIPHLMKTRADAQTFFDEKIYIDDIDSYIRSKKELCMNNISFLHIVIASLVRTMSQKPALNRFVAGRKIYARNDIFVSLAVKKHLIENSPETTIKFKFEPTDTLDDVVNKVNALIEENKKDLTSNDTDKTANIISLCPNFLIKFVVWLFETMDYFGFMTKLLNQVSPFHTSLFITDLGSLGIQPVYHHIYNFGTTSLFMAFGAKQREKVIDKDNNIVERKYINLKIVTDERITDGYYYATAFKLFKYLMMHPEKLELPPEKIIEDIE